MNKTVTVNLGGIVFHIDEDAYEILKNYLETIRRHFGKSQGASEIMSDIESRFSEIFTEKLKDGRQVIQRPDVDQAILTMGKPEDITGNATAMDEETHTFESGAKTRKRFYRNPDDKVIGGVCSGIATYFDFDPLWLRLAFAVSFFVFGSGFLLYLVLMIIIPKARTTAEKLEMRGEAVNIPNIEKSIKEEFEQFKSKVKDFTNDASDATRKMNTSKVKGFIEQIFEFVVQIITRFVKAIAKILAAIFVFFGLIILVVLGFGIMDSLGWHSSAMQISSNGFGYQTHDLSDLSAMIFSSNQQKYLILIGLLFVIGIPVLKILVSGIQFLFNIKTNNRFMNIGLSIIWFLGLIVGLTGLMQLSTDFSKQATVQDRISIMQPTGNTLIVDAEEIDSYDEDLSALFSSIALKIVKADSNEFELIKGLSARGRTIKEASARASAINFSMEQNDSLLRLNPLIHLNANDRFRNQKIKLILKVPVGKTIYLSQDLENIHVEGRNEEHYWGDQMLGHHWQMGEKRLHCVDCLY